MRGYALAQRWSWALLVLVSLVGELSTTCPPCPPPPAACMLQDELTRGECLYTINNNSKDSLEILTDETYFKLQCPSNVFLGDDVLPALETFSQVRKVVLNGCGVPNVTFAQALARLNVSAIDQLNLEYLFPAKLQSDHFKGLDHIRTLMLSAKDSKQPLEAEGSLFESLTSLTKLHVYGVRLPAIALENLPSKLEELSLRQCGIRQIPDIALNMLTRLDFLILVEDELKIPPNISALPHLHKLTINAPLLEQTPVTGGIVNLTIEAIKNVQFEGNCESLYSLTVRTSSIAVLPERWVAQCNQLTYITLVVINLTLIPNNTLENATELRELKLTNSRKLTSLPADLFRDTINLVHLDLSRNNLTSLPQGIFVWLNKLEWLGLSGNNFGLGVPTDIALKPLNALKELKHLELDENPLGDLCVPPNRNVATHDVSLLQELKALEFLSLANTKATRICTDWQRDMTVLKELYLTRNNIVKLEAWDLQWNRQDGVEVNIDLSDNPVNEITIKPEEVVFTRGRRVTAHFSITSSLQCDCHMYWFAQALQGNLLQASFPNLQCATKSTRRKMPLMRLRTATMVCPVTDNCPKGCECTLHPENATTIMKLSCQNHQMNFLPDVSKLQGTYLELNLTNTSLKTLPPIISNRITLLDLRHNELQEFSPPIVNALVSRHRKVWLAGNPLTCGCSDTLLRRLRVPSAADQIMDFGIAKCANGVPLLEAVRDGCWGVRAAVWGVGGAAITLAITASIFFALRKAVRLRLKAFLITRGLCVRWVKPDDNDDCWYDAFLSYSHEDWDISEIVRKNLEAGPRPLKLCVHWRDWPIGGWIPFQIANSVTKSRRTIILLSDNFMKSTWALVEFREAYARAIRETSVRLIVVILGDTPPGDLCPELQHYINNNTYLKWGDPAFWEKLRVALPEPRPEPQKPRKQRPKATPMPAPTGAKDQRLSPIFIDPMPNATLNPAPAPPTPIIKFAQIEFPTPVKPAKQIASPCA